MLIIWSDCWENQLGGGWIQRGWILLQSELSHLCFVTVFVWHFGGRGKVAQEGRDKGSDMQKMTVNEWNVGKFIFWDSSCLMVQYFTKRAVRQS